MSIFGKNTFAEAIIDHAKNTLSLTKEEIKHLQEVKHESEAIAQAESTAGLHALKEGVLQGIRKMKQDNGKLEKGEVLTATQAALSEFRSTHKTSKKPTGETGKPANGLKIGEVKSVPKEKFDFEAEKNIALHDTGQILMRFPKYKNETWAQDVLKLIAENDPIMAINVIFNNKGQIDSPAWLKAAMTRDLVESAVQKNPVDTLNISAFYESEPWYQEIITEDLVRKVIERDAYVALEKIKAYAAQPWVKTVFSEDAIREAIKPFGGEILLKNIVVFAYQPWIAGIMRDIAQKEPTVVLQYAGNISLYPWFQEIVTEDLVKKIFQLNPKLALDNFSHYADQAWSKNIFLECREKNPELLLNYLNSNLKLPWLEEVFTKDFMKQMAESHPSLVLPLFPYFYTENWGWNDVFDIIAQKPQYTKEVDRIKSAIWSISREVSGRPEDISSKTHEYLSDISLQYVSEVALSFIEEVYADYARENNIPINFETPRIESRFYHNLRVMVTRNLYFSGQKPSAEAISAEVRTILKTQEEYKTIPLFSGRNVLFAAHSEGASAGDTPGDKNKFGKQALFEKIKNDSTHTADLIRPENTLESLKKAKVEILQRVADTPPPFTFVFDGHGGPDAIYLSDGNIPGLKSSEIVETNQTVKISLEEFFDAYKKRQRFASTAKDIFISESCFNSTFLRGLLLECDKNNVSKPIVIGPSEYNQYSFSDLQNKHGSKFFEALFLGKDGKEGKATIGNIIEHDASLDRSNPSIYIPDEIGKTMQLSSNETDRETVPSAV